MKHHRWDAFPPSAFPLPPSELPNMRARRTEISKEESIARRGPDPYIEKKDFSKIGSVGGVVLAQMPPLVGLIQR